jgi:hypothetical protein
LLKKPKNTPPYVFYTNKNRKQKIKKLGGVPLPGLIKKPFKTACGAGVFVPDFKKPQKINSAVSHKTLKNNSLSVFEVGDFIVHIIHGVGEFSGLVIRGPQGVLKGFLIKPGNGTPPSFFIFCFLFLLV